MTNRTKSGRFTTAKKEEEIIMSDPNGTTEVKPMLTLSQAVVYMKSFDPKINKTKLKTILEAPKNSLIFVAGDTLRVTHFHAEVPDLIEVAPYALDDYISAKARGTVGKRATRSGKPRKYTQYIEDARIAEYQALVLANGFSEAVPAYKARAKKDAATTAVAPVVPQTDEIEDLISA